MRIRVRTLMAAIVSMNYALVVGRDADKQTNWIISNLSSFLAQKGRL